MAASLEVMFKEIINTLGKVIGQINLYNSQHPLAQKMIGELYALFSQGFADGGLEEIVFALDHDKLLINGRQAGSLKDQPTAMTRFFTGFRLHSLSFIKGLSQEELSRFCSLLSTKIQDPDAFKLQEWLAENQIVNVKANEVVYTKVQKGQDILVAEAESGGGGAKGGPQTTGDAGAGTSFEKAGGSTPAAVQAARAGVPAKQIGPAFSGSQDTETEISGPEAESLRRLLLRLIQIIRPNAEQEISSKIVDVALMECKKELQQMTQQAGQLMLEQIGKFQNEIRRIETVLKKVTQSSVTVNMSGQVVAQNEGADKILGRQDTAGHLLEDLVDPSCHLLVISRDLGQMPSQPIHPAIFVKSSREMMETLGASMAWIRNEADRVVGWIACLPKDIQYKEYEQLKKDAAGVILKAFQKPVAAIESALK